MSQPVITQKNIKISKLNVCFGCDSALVQIIYVLSMEKDDAAAILALLQLILFLKADYII